MLRFGFIADGLFKMLVAIVSCALLPVVEDFFLAPRWLVLAACVLLFLSAATEISYGVRKAEKSHIKYLIGFDVLWVLSAVAAVILALGENIAAGFVWFGFLGLGSLAVAIVFTTGVNGPDFGTESSSDTDESSATKD